MSDINCRQDLIIADFSEFDDSFDRYAYLIELAAAHPGLPTSKKIPALAVSGCQSQVWLDIDSHDSKLIIAGDSDTLVVRGILAIIISILSGHSAKEILAAQLYVFEKAGLSEALPRQRQEGLRAILQKITDFASKSLDS